MCALFQKQNGTFGTLEQLENNQRQFILVEVESRDVPLLSAAYKIYPSLGLPVLQVIMIYHNRLNYTIPQHITYRLKHHLFIVVISLSIGFYKSRAYRSGNHRVFTLYGFP